VASAAKNRPVLPAAVIRFAPFEAGVELLVAESVGFRSPEETVCVGLELGVTAFERVVVGVVVLDWVMAN